MIREKPHKKLDLRQKSMELVTNISKAANTFASGEEFGLSRSDPFGKIANAKGSCVGPVQYFGGTYADLEERQASFP